jgi:hypothetical protein
LEEQRQRLPEAVYRQLFENEWTQAAGSFLDPAVIEAAFRLDGPALERELGGRFVYAAGLDLGTVNDRTVLSIGHRDGDRVVLDRMQSWQGSRKRPVNFAEVERFILDAHRRFSFSLRLDPWQGLDLAQRLRGAGVYAEEFSFSQMSKQRLAATLLSTVNAGNLVLYDAEGLREELLALRLVQSSSGAWGFDHQRGGHDDRVVALALMTVALLERVVPDFDLDVVLRGAFRPDPMTAAWDGPTRPVRRLGLWRDSVNGLSMFAGAVDPDDPEAVRRFRTFEEDGAR